MLLLACLSNGLRASVDIVKDVQHPPVSVKVHLTRHVVRSESRSHTHLAAFETSRLKIRGGCSGRLWKTWKIT